MTEYVSAAHASAEAAISKSRVIALARQGEILGAKQLDNGVWLIPEEWAEEQRRKKTKAEKMITASEAARMAGVSRAAIYKAL